MRKRMVYAEVSRSAEGATVALGAYRPRGRARLLERLIAGACAAFALLALWSASASAKLAHPYLSSFGAFGSVEGVAVDQSTGDVYVYDSGAKAILKYDAAGAPAEFSSTKTNAIAGVPGSGGAEAEIAVDSSTGPAKGDIYLAHGGTGGILVFNEAGEQVGSLTEEAGVPWGETCGVSVDESGAVYVGIYPSYVDKYVPKANPVTNADYTSSIQGANTPCNVAVDGAGNVFAATYSNGPITRYQPSQFGSLAAIGSVVDFEGSTLAVDPANDDVYVDQGSRIAQFGASGEPFEEPLSTFAGSGEAGAITGSEGIAVDETTGDVYVSDGKGPIHVFGPAGPVPTVHTGGTPGLTAETATVAGEVDPEGVPVEECYFEYWTTAFDHQRKQCTESTGEIGDGNGFVAVHAELSGLSAEVTYHYMLAVSNKNGAVAGAVAAFRFVPPVTGEFVPPLIEGEQVSDVSASSAELEASVNPKGNVTEYHFEYGPTESYGASTPTLRTGEDASLLTVGAHVQGLTAETVYHYRLVATSGAGTTEGADHTFTTEGDGGPLTLLDGRQWELVSPPEKHGAGIIAQRNEGGVIQAAEDGNGLVYMAQNPIETEPEGNSAPEPTQILARRLPDGGWSNRTMTTPSDDTHGLPIGEGTEYRLFSPSLSGSILEPSATEALAPGVTQHTVYLRSELECPEDKTNCYTPLLSSEDTAPGAEYVGAHFVVASKDLDHALITSRAPLIEGAPEGGLYEWSEGALQLVSIDESGAPVRAEAGGAGSEGNVRGAISNDGSRVFFCKRTEFFGCESNGPLYMRHTVTQESVRLDPATSTGREFQIATEDGFRAFFTYREASPTWHLDECEVQEVAGKLSCERGEVAPEAVGSVLGIDGSGEIVYFVAKAALAGEAVAGADNLYVSRLEGGKWVPTFIAALSPEDSHDWGSGIGGHAEMDNMTSRVSPNGRYLAFMSDRGLTGYDNHDAVSGEPDQEVFLYDERSGKLSCPSCNPTGARPEGMPYESGLEPPLVNKQGIWRGNWIAASVPAWDNISLNKSIHQTSYLTDEGRLFFNSSDDLSAQDSNGLVDVYEYEPAGVGSCATSEGCVQLISSGTSGEESVFLDASANGDDVFFITSSQLTTQDDDTAYDVYDAHVCSSEVPCEQPPVSPPPCTNGESCKPGQTPQPAIYGAAASATFSGAGNLAPVVPVTRKAKAKAGARRQKLRKALGACGRTHAANKRKLRKCRAHARRRYGKAARQSGHEKARGRGAPARRAPKHPGPHTTGTPTTGGDAEMGAIVMRASKLRLALVARVSMLAAACAAVMVLLSATPALASSGAWWHVGSVSFPTQLEPGGTGFVSVSAVNRGYQSADGVTSPITITDVLPPGVEATAVHSRKEPAAAACTFGAHNSASCTYEAAVRPYARVWMVIAVKVVAHPAASEVSEVSVSGGNAAAEKVQSVLHLEGGEPQFGVESYELAPEEVGGGLATQAGAHPFQLTTTITFDKTGQFPQGGSGVKETFPEPISGIPMQPALPKDVNVKLPPGLIGNPTPFPQCTAAQFTADQAYSTNECPQDTAVGVANVMIDEPKVFGIRMWQPPVFNLVPERGEPARFGFTIEDAPVYLDASVRTGGDYGVTVHVTNISQLATLLESEVVFWGVPGDPRHDISRGWQCSESLGLGEKENLGAPCKLLEEQHPQPLLVMPTSCTGPLQTGAEVDSWKEPKHVLTYGLSTPLPGMDGCNRESFAPRVSLTPDGQQGSTASGLTVDVHVPQEESLAPSGLAQANVKDTTVTLPEGLVLNPSAADGLLSCSLEQISLDSGAAATCPEAAKVGTVTIHTPLLPDPLTGAAYLAAQNANPFGSLVALYVVAEDAKAGVLVKLAGEVKLSASGQVTSTFRETPQLPFEDFELEFFGGARAPLATPAACGSYTTNASLAPWSGTAAVPSSSTFLITSGPNGSSCASQLGFSPTLTGGMQDIQAGEFSRLTTTMSRNDGEQPLQSVALKFPPGLMGTLTGVELCAEANADAGTCGPGSLIGHTVVSVGIGNDPYSVTGGRVYMTGPYKGAPFGLSIVEPAVAGPFNLGTVVVRAKVEVDPHTAQLTVTTDPSGPYAIPQILDGIPLQIRHVNVTIDREGFTFNPTSCEKMAIVGTLGSADGANSAIAVPFQVTNCAALPFKPKLTATTKAKHTRKGGAYLRVDVSSSSGQADIGKAKVELPKKLPSRLSTLQKACTEAQFDANPAGCPAASQVGSVVVHTPVVPVPLTGPAYFVSRGAQWPELIMVLQGYGVTVDLAGETFISKAGVTSTTLGSVPDVPFTSFQLTLPEGPHSALAGNGNLCKKQLVMPTKFTGQNGALVEQKVKVKVSGCAATRKKRKGKRARGKKPKGK